LIAKATRLTGLVTLRLRSAAIPIILGQMSIAELRKLPATEKLKIIEALWSDLAADDEAFASPAWHEDALRETEAGFAAGRIEALDWEDAKKELRKRTE
jgi:hypothetical protein